MKELKSQKFKSFIISFFHYFLISLFLVKANSEAVESDGFQLFNFKKSPSIINSKAPSLVTERCELSSSLTT